MAWSSIFKPKSATELLLGWVLVGAVGVLVVAVGIGVLFRDRLVSGSPPTTNAAAAPSSARASSSVALVIDFGDGTQKVFPALAVRSGTPASTVLDVLQSASGVPGPRTLRIDVRGSGEMAFLSAIDGVANEPAGIGGGRFWQFWVNGQYATRSMGVTTVGPGDVVSLALAGGEPGKPPMPPVLVGSGLGGPKAGGGPGSP